MTQTQFKLALWTFGLLVVLFLLAGLLWLVAEVLEAASLWWDWIRWLR